MKFSEITERKDRSVGKVNPRTALQLKRSRARHPQATSDLDAFIIDYQKGQRQDRVDIGRLDDETDELEQENDQDQQKIRQLEREIEQIKNRSRP